MSAHKFKWERDTNGGWQCQMPGDISLVVSPERYAKGFIPKPARGTKWHAQCSQWDEGTRTISRFGRDEYRNLQASFKDAMRLAEDIYATAGLSAGGASNRL